VMLLTSAACFGSQRAKLHRRDSGAPSDTSTAVLQVLHSSTASLQALHVLAAAHRMRTLVLKAGCCSATLKPSDRRDAVCNEAHRVKQQMAAAVEVTVGRNRQLRVHTHH
jgi:hypothetical protein